MRSLSRMTATTTMTVEIPPSFLFFAGALVTPLLRGRVRNCFLVALPAIGFWLVSRLPGGSAGTVSFLAGLANLEPLRVDSLSKAFGYIFCLNGFVAFLFAFYVKKSTQHVAALIYMGGALGAVFAGDLLSLYVFW